MCVRVCVCTRLDLRTPPRLELGNDCEGRYLWWIDFFISAIRRNKGGTHRDRIDEQKTAMYTISAKVEAIPTCRQDFYLTVQLSILF